MSQLSENLKAIRNHLKLTQFGFSKTLGIGFRTYVRYEIGEREPPIAVLVRISTLIKVSLDSLILYPLQINEFDTFSKKSAQEKKSGALERTTNLSSSEEKQQTFSKKEEKNFLNLYRKMNGQTREKCLEEMKILIKNSFHNKNAEFLENSKTKKIAKLKKDPNLPKRVGAKN